MKIYKYFSSPLIANVFSSPDQVTLKCSLPKDFNDPYELFLTIDFDEQPDALAFYADAIGELTQFPTTCFSRSPDVIPMWAHYSENHKGFAIEISEECLEGAIPESNFGNVTYSDHPSEDLTDLLYRAFTIGKYRYTYMLRQGVFHAAYFTKTSCWSYEQERRLLVPEKNTRTVSSELVLLDTPSSCVDSIIVGARATSNTKQELAKLAKELDCQYFEIRIGKTSAKPYFVNAQGEPFLFDGQAIIPSSRYCETCLEPIATESLQGQCSWCQIDDQLRKYAASRNPFRMLDRFGLLEEYIADMDAISAGKSKK